MKKVDKYVSVYSEEYDKANKGKKRIVESSIKSLMKIKSAIKKLKEEDLSSEEISDKLDDIVDKVEDIVTDAIDTLGASDPAVDTLIDTAKELDGQAGLSDIITEDEDKDDDDKKDDEDKKDGE